MDARCLLVERIGAVMRIQLTRPEALNALDARMAAELLAAADEAAADPTVRAVLLTGAGRAFCSGADLTPGALPARADQSRGQNTRRILEELFNPIVIAWTSLPKPVVVAVNGVAAGGGVGLALCGDLMLMAKSATLLQVFVPKLALVPDMGCTYLLGRALGPARAKAVAMLGTPITAEQAVAWGLAWECVDDAELAARGLALAGRLARAPTAALAGVKALYDNVAPTCTAQLALEAELQGVLADTADHAEGIAAFAGKRTPAFTGA